MPLLLLLTLYALAGARPVSPAHGGNCQAPSWSSDGSMLAYEVNFHDQKRIDLFVYEPGKGEPRQVAPTRRGGSSLTAGFSTTAVERVAHEASWSPAPVNLFVYSASNEDRDYDLYLDRGAGVAVAPGADGTPVWSPDGRWIAFTSARTGQGDLYRLDAHRLDQPPVRLTTDPQGSELYADFSANGKSVVFVAHTDRGDNLYLIDDVTQPTVKTLTSWPRTQTRPSFSPDGQRVAFYANKDDNERFDLYVMRLGGTPYPLARGVVMSHDGPAWTPDGNHIVYVLDDDTRFNPVYRVDPSNPDTARPVATDTVGNGDLDLTRGTDGRTWLAVAAQGRTGDATRDYKRIYVMTLD